MKLHLGAVPENQDFDPDGDGWAGIREPGPILIQFLAVPVAFIAVLALGGILLLVWPLGSVGPSTPLVITLLLLLIPAHELLHALCFPGGLGSAQTVIGFWPSRGLFYAHYEGAMSRNRFLITFFAPLFVLSILPIALIALFRWPSFELAFIAVINAAFASGDILGMLFVGFQIPATALVRNRGWRTYWKPAEPGQFL